MSDLNNCRVCGDPIPNEYAKFDDDAPVYGPEPGQVHHLGCEDELFEEVVAEL